MQVSEAINMYMVKRLFLGLFLLSALSSFSQKSNINVIRSEKIVGKNLLNNSAIIGVEFYFPKSIFKTYADTVSNLLSVQLCKLSKSKETLRNKGKLIVCNLEDGKVKWEKKVYYHTSFLRHCANSIIHTIDHESYCLNANNGKLRWKLKNNLSLINREYNIGIGYKYKDFVGYPNIIQGVDLSDGTVKWERKIKKEYGWNQVFRLSDSIHAIVASGFHLVNVKTGKGWDYNAITGEENYVADDDIRGSSTGPIPVHKVGTEPNTAMGVVSNAVVDGSSVYIASKDKISRIDLRTGVVVWSRELNTMHTSSSTIFIKDNLVYMINKGDAHMRGRRICYGSPFIAAFSKENGNQQFLNLVNIKGECINGFQVNEERLLLLFRNKISEYSLKTGERIIEKEVDVCKYGELISFVGNHVYKLMDDKSYVCLPDSDTSKIFISTKEDQIIVIDSLYNVVDKIENKKLSVCNLETDEFRFIIKGNKTIVLNNNGERVAELFLSSNTILKGTKLYDVQDNRFIVLDVSKLVAKP